MHFTSTQIKKMLDHPSVKRRVISRVNVDFNHDIPGLVGVSKNGRTVYVDQHLTPRNKDTVKALKTYILTRKTLVDILKVPGFHAKQIAAHTLLPYADTFLHNVKLIKSPDIKHIPTDLDLNLYHPADAHRLKQKMRKEAKRKKDIDIYHKSLYDKQSKESINARRDLHQSGLSPLRSGETATKKQ